MGGALLKKTCDGRWCPLMVWLLWKTVAAVKACSDCPDSREVPSR
jgi:hypothetical protein